MKYNDFYNYGFQIIENVLEKKQIDIYKEALLKIYKEQIRRFGLENTRAINEENLVRSPFLYDEIFYELFLSKSILNIVNDILGDHAILSLQNAIMVSKQQKHNQTFYHRDIIYQDFVSSKPLGINVYYCLDDYNKENGGTSFLVGSHKQNSLNYDSKEITPQVNAGSIILFDSMIYHKAGINLTENTRFGVNNMFTLPFIKQQFNYCHILGDKIKNKDIRKLLGYNSREHLSIKKFRDYRLSKKKENAK